MRDLLISRSRKELASADSVYGFFDIHKRVFKNAKSAGCLVGTEDNKLQCSPLFGEVKSAVAIQKMREACRVAADALQLALETITVGKTPLEIEKVVIDYLSSKNATSAALGYQGFPRSAIVSVNNICCHGIPNSRPFESGDIVKFDSVVCKNGLHGDCCATLIVGRTSERRERLVAACRRARDAAIEICKPGVALREIGNVISSVAESEGFGNVSAMSGHFIGTNIHMLPFVPHCRNRSSYLLKPGNTFTIEPIFTEGSSEVAVLADGWSVSTKDRGYTSQWEHTVLVTQSGVEVLTALGQETVFTCPE